MAAVCAVARSHPIAARSGSVPSLASTIRLGGSVRARASAAVTLAASRTAWPARASRPTRSPRRRGLAATTRSSSAWYRIATSGLRSSLIETSPAAPDRRSGVGQPWS